MSRSSQYRYNFSMKSAPGGFLGRVVTFIIGMAMLALAVFLGAVFLAALVGIVLIAAIIIAVRVWWLKRKMERHTREHGDISAEYTVVEEQRRKIDRQ
jgi:predicted lipid-binding transport protein (Tim44 family)